MYSEYSKEAKKITSKFYPLKLFFVLLKNIEKTVELYHMVSIPSIILLINREKYLIEAILV